MKPGPAARPKEWHKKVGSHHTSEHKNEPDALAADPEMPRRLSGRPEAVALWNEMRDRLSELTLWSRQFTESLALLCEAHANYLDAQTEARDHSQFIGRFLHPAWRRVDECQAVYFKLLKEFGATPASKTMLRVDSGEGEPKSKGDALQVFGA